MTTTEIRQQVLEFAASYPTPNVREMVAYCHAGRITWEQAYELCTRSLTAALVEVSA